MAATARSLEHLDACFSASTIVAAAAAGGVRLGRTEFCVVGGRAFSFNPSLA